MAPGGQAHGVDHQRCTHRAGAVVAGTVVPFTLRAGAPLVHEGKVVGTVGIGISLASEAYVDRLKKETGLEATIFKGDIRAMLLKVDKNKVPNPERSP